MHESTEPTSALADRSGPERIHRHGTNIIYNCTYFPNMVMEMEISTILRHYGSSMHEPANTSGFGMVNHVLVLIRHPENKHCINMNILIRPSSNEDLNNIETSLWSSLMHEPKSRTSG